ncbi:competence protein ComA [Lonepinella sp. BR2271]|uniref:competence protein ComA n=1 Tax=Lonepinella sp. BR2271 TaxID=3434550 RepID=UPI003F6DAC31
MKKFIKKNSAIQVGIWSTPRHFEFVWFTADNMAQKTPHFCRVESNAINEISTILFEQVSQQMEIQRPLSIQWVTAILPHKIWFKSLHLQEQLNQSECDQQCRYTLENELPIPLDELWFDYTTTQRKQGLRLDIFAVRQSVAQSLLIHFLPLKIKVLDTVVGCLYRAFSYLLKQTLSNQSLCLYQDQQCTILFRQTQQEWQILSQPLRADLNALYAQFVQRYEQPIKEIFLYTDNEKVQFTEKYHAVNSDIPLIPLGAALWQTDWKTY